MTAVLDLDDDGPAFGVRALDALRAPGASLSGVDIDFRHLTYDWSQTGRLREALDDLRASDAGCAISSEGGLFEYGSDAEILSNLETLHAGTAPDAIAVGSVTRDGEPVRAAQTTNRVSTHPRTLEAFERLAAQAGWIVHRVIQRPFTYNVRLVKD